MIKNYIFCFLITVCVLGVAVSLFLSQIFDIVEAEYTRAFADFLISGVTLVEAKFADKPFKFRFANNARGLFQKIGKPKIYRIICLAVFSIFFALGFIDFFKGLIVLL